MDSNKVYKDIVYLLYNILDNEKLRYELYKDDEYRNLYISLVDDLLTLEKDNEATFNDEQWATTYGKAIVVISQAKQRFERLENKSVEKIYEDYSKMIAFSVNSFEVKRDVLTKDKLKFTKEDVLYNGRLDDDTIKKYDELAKEAEAQKQKEQEETIFLNENKKARPNEEQAQGGYNPFGQQPNGQSFEDFANNLPKNPMQDPRFYPYTKKPKWMPILKIILGVFVILTSVLLIAASAFAMSATVNLADTKAFDGIVVDPTKITVNGQAIDKDIKTLGAVFNKYFNYKQGIDGNPKDLWSHIISYIFYCIPAAYLGWACFRKPNSTADKYRMSYWPIVFMIIFFGLSIVDSYQFAGVQELHDSWYSFMKGSSPTDMKAFDSAFDSWWTNILESQHVLAITVVMDVAIGFLVASVIFGVVMCAINPRVDKIKVNKAMSEYQRAYMSAMQGIPYTMDPSLFENDDDVIIKNKSKFALWWENLFKKKNKKNKKNKDNDKKDK